MALRRGHFRTQMVSGQVVACLTIIPQSLVRIEDNEEARAGIH
jgi:hypothetical protein